MDARRLATVILALSSAAPLVRAMSVFEYFNVMTAELVNTFSGWIIGAIYNAMIFTAITSAIFVVFRLHHFAIPLMRSILTRLVSELPMWMGVIRAIAPIRKFASFMYKGLIRTRFRPIRIAVGYTRRMAMPMIRMWARIGSRIGATSVGRRLGVILGGSRGVIEEIKGRIDENIVKRVSTVLDPAAKAAQQAAQQARQVARRAEKYYVNIKGEVEKIIRDERVQRAWSRIKFVWDVITAPTLAEAIMRAAKVGEWFDRKLEAEYNPVKRGLLYLTAIWIGARPREWLPPGASNELKLFHLHHHGEAERTENVIKKDAPYHKIVNERKEIINSNIGRQIEDLQKSLEEYVEKHKTLTEKEKKEVIRKFEISTKKIAGSLRHYGVNIDEQIEHKSGLSFEELLRLATIELEMGNAEFALELLRHLNVKIEANNAEQVATLSARKEIQKLELNSYMLENVLKVLKQENDRNIAWERIEKIDREYANRGADPLYKLLGFSKPEEFKDFFLKYYDVIKGNWTRSIEDKARAYREQARTIAMTHGEYLFVKRGAETIKQRMSFDPERGREIIKVLSSHPDENTLVKIREGIKWQREGIVYTQEGVEELKVAHANPSQRSYNEELSKVEKRIEENIKRIEEVEKLYEGAKKLIEAKDFEGAKKHLEEAGKRIEEIRNRHVEHRNQMIELKKKYKDVPNEDALSSAIQYTEMVSSRLTWVIKRIETNDHEGAMKLLEEIGNYTKEVKNQYNGYLKQITEFKKTLMPQLPNEDVLMKNLEGALKNSEGAIKYIDEALKNRKDIEKLNDEIKQLYEEAEKRNKAGDSEGARKLLEEIDKRKGELENKYKEYSSNLEKVRKHYEKYLNNVEEIKKYADKLEGEAKKQFERLAELTEMPREIWRAFSSPKSFETAIFEKTPVELVLEHSPERKETYEYIKENMKYGDKNDVKYALHKGPSYKGASAGWLIGMPSDPVHGAMLKGGVTNQKELKRIIEPKGTVLDIYHDEFSTLKKMQTELPKLQEKQAIAKELGEWLEGGGAAKLKEYLSSGNADKEVLDNLEKLRQQFNIEVKNEGDINRAIEITKKWSELNLDPRNVEAAMYQMSAEMAEALGNPGEAKAKLEKLNELRKQTNNERLGMDTLLETLEKLSQLDPSYKDLYSRIKTYEEARKSDLRKLEPAIAGVRTGLETVHLVIAYIYRDSGERIAALKRPRGVKDPKWLENTLDWLEKNKEQILEHLLGHNYNKEIDNKLKELRKLGIVIEKYEDLNFVIDRLSKLRNADPEIFEAAEIQRLIKLAREFRDNERAAAYEKELIELYTKYLDKLEKESKSIEDRLNELDKKANEYKAKLGEIETKLNKNEGNREELENEKKRIEEEMKNIEEERKKLNADKEQIEWKRANIDEVLSEKRAMEMLEELSALNLKLSENHKSLKDLIRIYYSIFNTKEPTRAEIVGWIATFDPDLAEYLLKRHHSYLDEYADLYKDAEYPWIEAAKHFGDGLMVEVMALLETSSQQMNAIQQQPSPSQSEQQPQQPQSEQRPQPPQPPQQPQCDQQQVSNETQCNVKDDGARKG